MMMTPLAETELHILLILGPPNRAIDADSSYHGHSVEQLGLGEDDQYGRAIVVSNDVSDG